MKKMILVLLALSLIACGGGPSSPTPVTVVPTPAPTPTPTPVPIYTFSGSGDTVFDLPARITRIRIQGAYGGYTSNFIVKIAGRLVVNELLGTGWGKTTHDGTYLIAGGGVVEITNSSGVSWAFTEVRQ